MSTETLDQRRRARVSDEEVGRIHADYVRLKSLHKTAALHGRRHTTIYVLLRSRGLIKRTRRRKLSRKVVAAMVEDYRRLGSLAKVAALHGRTRQSVWDILSRRGKTHARPPSRGIIEHGGQRYALDKHGAYRLTSTKARTTAREIYLHRVLWTEAHGEIPAHHEIVFADGNRKNFDAGNLTCQPPAAASRAACFAKYGDANPSRFTRQRLLALWAAISPEDKIARLEKGLHKRHVKSREAKLMARVESCQGWIIKQARKFAMRHNVEMNDLMQEGRLGALEAARRHDPKKGKFFSYAVHWIKSRMQRFVMNCSKDVRVPVGQFWKHQTHESSFDAPVGEDGDATLGDLMGADESVTHDADADDRAELLQTALAKLPERERAVLHARFFEDKTFEEIGAEQGVTRERIRQIEFSALKKLRKFSQLKERMAA
jgi:RNA polymerase primary sigma factor